VIHAEIQYGDVHSDICPSSHTAHFTETYRKFLHANLDEWLNRSGGEGFFYIGSEKDLRANFAD